MTTTMVTMTKKADLYLLDATSAMDTLKWKCGVVWSMDQDAVIAGKHHD
jgi:hypothetical protein